MWWDSKCVKCQDYIVLGSVPFVYFDQKRIYHLRCYNRGKEGGD